MNYSKQGIIKKQRQIKSTSRRVTSKLKISFIRLTILFFVGLIIIGAFAGFGAVRALIDTVPSTENLNLITTSYKTTLYYSDGSISDTLFGAEANRSYVTIDKIPDCVKYAFIAKEDSRFYEHNGIDIKGIFRAVVSVVKTRSLEYGGSTITQQLIKNQVFGGGNETDPLDKIVRKFQEQYLAIQVENELDKDTILEYYLNNINLGNGSYGVQTAAQNYFDKNVDELTLSEAAVLAPIAYSPTYRNPILYPEQNAEKRLETLDKMLENNFCTQEEYDEALADDVYARIQDHDQSTNESIPYSYFTDELIEQVLSDLQEKLGYTEKEASDLLYKGGLKIYTTQDREIQDIVDTVYTDETYFPPLGEGSYYELTYALSVTRADGTTTHYQQYDLMNYFADYKDTNHYYYHEDGDDSASNWVGISALTLNADDINAKCDEFKEAMTAEGDTVVEKRIVKLQPQSSMVIIDQSTGKVVALYGGRGKKTESLSLNRATNTVRQVGSTFKVLASFLPALDTAGMTLATVFDDSEYYYPDTEKEVINWYTTGFRGLQSIRTAIYNSMNIIAVKTLAEVTPQIGFDYLEKLGFSTLVASKTVGTETYSDIGLPLALGGLTDGVTNLELTAAYATIANAGKYQEPIFYTMILDSDGKVLIDNKSESSQVMKTSTAWLLTNAMEDTITLGTGKRLDFSTEYDMPIAGKTGTASGSNDLWFVGYTPYYTAGIWTGFDNNFDQISTKYHQYMWHDIMLQICQTKNLAYKDFEMPDSIVTAQICTKCGKLAVVGLCDNYIGGDCIATEYFAKGTVPTEKCDCHVKVTIDTATGQIATADTPLANQQEVVYLIKDEDPTLPETYDTPYILPFDMDTGTANSNSSEVLDNLSATPSVMPTAEESDDTVLPQN